MRCSRPERRGRADRGSVAIEAALLAPVIVTFVLLAVAAGRLQTAAGTVDAAARAGARTASITRAADEVEKAARKATDEVLRQDGVSCNKLEVTLTKGMLDTPAGQLATMTVTVTCDVGLSDLVVAGLPGSKTLTGRFTSVVDRYRGQ